MGARVKALVVYPRDVVVVRSASVPRGRVDNPERAPIGAWTREMGDALTFLAANCGVEWTGIVLFTYPEGFDTDGALVKADLNRVFTGLRKRWGKAAYIWVREYQERGATHFHCLVSWEVQARAEYWRDDQQKHVTIDPVMEAHAHDLWCRSVQRRHPVPSTGLIVRWELVRDKEGGAKYMAEYAAKDKQKKIPAGHTNTGRWWMPSHGCKARPIGSRPMNEDGLALLYGGREVASNGEVYRVIHGGASEVLAWEVEKGLAVGMPVPRVVALRHKRECTCGRCWIRSERCRLNSEAYNESRAANAEWFGVAWWLQWWDGWKPLERCAARASVEGWMAVDAIPATCEPLQKKGQCQQYPGKREPHPAGEARGTKLARLLGDLRGGTKKARPPVEDGPGGSG